MRTRVVGAAAGAVLLVTVGTGVAGAAPPRYGIPDRVGGLDVAALLEGRVVLAKADGAASLARQTLRVYAYETSGPDAATATSRAWVVTRPGTSPTYGSFAPFTVTGHAGSKAVSATFVQVQVVEPVSATYLPMTIASLVVADGRTTTVRASTTWAVTAASVDGAAVDIGTTCSTAQTLAVKLTGDPDFSDLGGGFLRGTFTLPAFTGCDAVTRGTSAVLTKAFSGSGNSVVLARGAAGSWDTTSPRDCRECGRPPVIA